MCGVPADPSRTIASPISITPLSGVRTPAIRFSNVLLPHPLYGEVNATLRHLLDKICCSILVRNMS